MLLFTILVDDLVAHTALGRTSVALNCVSYCQPPRDDVFAVRTLHIIWNILIRLRPHILLDWLRVDLLRHLPNPTPFFLSLYIYDSNLAQQ